MQIWVILKKIYYPMLILEAFQMFFFSISILYLVLCLIYERFKNYKIKNVIIILLIINLVLIIVPKSYILLYKYLYNDKYFSENILNQILKITIDILIITILSIINISVINRNASERVDFKAKEKFLNIFSLSENNAAALSYYLGFITAIFILLIKDYRKRYLIRFHSFQSIFLSICFISYIIICDKIISVIYTEAKNCPDIIIDIIGLGYCLFIYLFIHLIITTKDNKIVRIPIIWKLSDNLAKCFKE